MTRKEAERLTMQERALRSLGFTFEQARALRRISMTLQRWHELECGNDRGHVERENDDGTGKPFMVVQCATRTHRYRIADRETGARKRLAAIIAERNTRRPEPVSAYIQGDPRGAALYIIRPGDVPEGADVGAYYSRGLVVY